MVAASRVALLALGKNDSERRGFGRFLGNPRVTVERLIEGWSDRTAVAAAG